MRKFMQAKWAEFGENGQLIINSNEREFKMFSSQGTGQPLVTDGEFGADIIQFGAGKCVNTHTHKGDHILFVLTGKGIVEYFDEKHDLYPGMSYFVPGDAPHAIRAETDLVLIAVGNNHKPVDSAARLTVVNKEQPQLNQQRG